MYGDAGKIPPAAGGAGLAYTGFNTLGWVIAALTLIITGALILRMSYLRRSPKTAAE